MFSWCFENDTMNNFMNQNWQPVFDGLIPGYELHFGNKFKEK